MILVNVVCQVITCDNMHNIQYNTIWRHQQTFPYPLYLESPHERDELEHEAGETYPKVQQLENDKDNC